MATNEERAKYQRAFAESATRPVIVDHVHVDGLTFTNPETVTYASKAVFEAKTVAEALQAASASAVELQRLGIFKSIEVTVDAAPYQPPPQVHDPSSPQHIEVTFNVTESSRLAASSGTLIGNAEVDWETNATLRNALFGRAEKLSLNYAVGMRNKAAYMLDYIQPISGDPDRFIHSSAYQVLQGNLTPSSYDEMQRGWNFGYTTRSRYGVHRLQYEARWREVLNIPFRASMLVREQAGHSLLSSIKHVLTHDTRNDTHLATQGKLVEWTQEFAGIGGDAKFIKSHVQAQFNQAFLNENLIVSASLWGGLLSMLGGTESRISDRFFLGGPNSLRGFTVRGAGPHDKGAYLGGDAYVAGAAHVYSTMPFKFLRDTFGRSLLLHGFASAGNITQIAPDQFVVPRLLSLFQPGSMRYSVGAGVVFRSGMARLELNYCVPFSAAGTDNFRAGFQVGLGVSFL